MIFWILITYLIIFMVFALWQEYYFIRNYSFIPERVLLIILMVLLFIINISWISDLIQKFNDLGAIEAGIRGLILALFYNLFIRKIMEAKCFSEKVTRTQIRLLYKMPLLGILTGLTTYKYLGLFHLWSGLFIFIIILLLLYFKYFRNLIISIFGLSFSCLILISCIIKLVSDELTYSYISFTSDLFLSLSIIILLIISKKKEEVR